MNKFLQSVFVVFVPLKNKTLILLCTAGCVRSAFLDKKIDQINQITKDLMVWAAVLLCISSYLWKTFVLSHGDLLPQSLPLLSLERSWTFCLRGQFQPGTANHRQCVTLYYNIAIYSEWYRKLSCVQEHGLSSAASQSTSYWHCDMQRHTV